MFATDKLMTKKIKLFFADIDGCLAQPYEPFDLNGFCHLRRWVERALVEPHLPRICLCSGRSYAYVEAIAQSLDLRAPALFESGGGLFDLRTARIRWNPALTPKVERDLGAVRVFFLEQVIAAGADFSLDYSKRAQTGVVNPDRAEVERFLPAVRGFVTHRFPDLRVYETYASIDVVPVDLTKLAALKWAATEEEVGLDEIAYVGDSRGDMEAIEAVGVGFAPRNGDRAVKNAADVVTDGAVIDGVLEAYSWCVKHNRLMDRSD